MRKKNSYIETIEMQGVCPTWLRGLGCRGAHRSERLQHRQPQHQPHLTTERTLSRAPRTSRPWTAQNRKRHRPAPVHGHQRLNGLRTRSDPTRAAELSISLFLWPTTSTPRPRRRTPCWRPRPAKLGPGDARILSTPAKTSLQPTTVQMDTAI